MSPAGDNSLALSVGRRYPVAGGVVMACALVALSAVLGAIMVVSPLYGFLAAAAVGAAWIYFRFRAFGIMTIFFIVPLGPLLWITSDGFLSVQKVLIAVLALVWVAQLFLTKDKSPFEEFCRSRLNVWGLLFLAVFLIPLPWCLEKDTAVLLIFRWLSHLLLFYFIVFNVRSFPMLRRCMATVVMIAALIAVVAIVENRTGTSVLEATGKTVLGHQAQLIKGEASGVLISSKEKLIRPDAEVAWSRAMATFKGPNELGLFLVLGAGLCVYFVFRPSASLIGRILAVFVFFLCLAALDATGSRGALSGLVAMLAAFVLFVRFPFKWFLIGLIGAVLLVALATPGQVGTQWRGGLNWNTALEDERIQWFQMSLAMFEDYPLAGIGLGQFEPRYFEYRVPNMHKLDQPPHNIVSQILAENGVLGIILLVFLIYAVVRELWQFRTKPVEDDHKLLGNVLLAIFAGILVFAMSSNVLLDETFWTFLTLAAIAASVYGAPREEVLDEEEEELAVVIMPRSYYGE